jgi:hypothetical protein
MGYHVGSIGEILPNVEKLAGMDFFEKILQNSIPSLLMRRYRTAGR